MSSRTASLLLHRIRPTLALTLLLGSVACTGEPAAPTTPLSEEERELVARMLLLAVLPTPSGDVAGAAAHPSRTTARIDLDVPCPADGSVRVDGTTTTTIDEATGAIRVEVLLSLDHRGCSVRSTDPPATVTVDGAPQVELGYSIVIDEGLFEVHGSVDGAVRYQAESRTGSCPADLGWSGAGGIEGGNEYEVAGTLCGAPIRTTIRQG